jgi:hypothetical protein
VVASEGVRVGATEAEVLSILGPPSARYPARGGMALLILGPRPSQWCYGTVINLRYVAIPQWPYPNPLPINLRIFNYDEDDLVVDWSPEGKVTGISRPAFQGTPVTVQLIKALRFLMDIYQIYGP